ncbi:flagellar protein MotY [Alteromonas flava]|uniref:flagellar protein MotY n=1 Tax=Alteromonas flava TaxID=2048003 RepID=UPI00196A8C82|nr:OmpA family protein [Alteromonas flava]
MVCLTAIAGFPEVLANMRQYAAEVEQSDWRVSTETRIACDLQHDIPGYGQAVFTSQASKQLNMMFELDMLMLPKRFDVAAVYSVPPSWMPGQQQKSLAEMTIRTQYNGDLPETTAWTMLSELEKGYWPTIYYQDWYNRFDKVAVALNAANFIPAYRQFVSCVSNLLPYSFEDIAYTVLSYKKNSVELNKYSERRLAMIADYLKEDPELELVLLDGYTDSYGGRWNNEQLSIRRANEIRDFFANAGVSPDRIDVTGHGEKRHIAPNNTEASRAQNRRVVIRMAKS